MNKTRFILLLVLAIIVVACTDSEQFRVNGRLKGKETVNLRTSYYARDAYHSQILAAREGEFEFYGKSPEGTIVTIMDYDYRPLAFIYARNGQTYEVTIDRSNVNDVEVSGNDESERWSRFLRENSEGLGASAARGNELIAGYIRTNPRDIVSTLLLLTAYDASISPAEADSLLTSIDVTKRPSSLTDSFVYSLQRLLMERDSARVVPFNIYVSKVSTPATEVSEAPLTVFVFSDNESRGPAFVATLKGLFSDLQARKMKLYDISLDADTTEWRASVRRDTATWIQGWAPGGYGASGVDRMAVPRLPFFVVSDSTGRQVLRSPSAAEVLDFAKEYSE